MVDRNKYKKIGTQLFLVFSIIFVAVFSFLVFYLFLKPTSNIDKYLSLLPEEESINASILHYEQIVEDVQLAYDNENYFMVLSNYENYLNVFFESEVDDESELNYMVGKTIRKLIDLPEFHQYALSKQQRISDLGLIVSRKPTLKISYNDSHFKSIIFEKKNYWLEEKTILEIYTKKFVPLSNKKDHNKNFDNIYYVITRYPHLFPAKKLMIMVRNQNYFSQKQLNRDNKKRLIYLNYVIDNLKANEQIADDSFNDIEDENSIYGKWYFPKDFPIVVRNRTHEINSRNIYRLELWEPFKIIGPAIGERVVQEDHPQSALDVEKLPLKNQPTWVKIQFYDHFGYMELDAPKMMLSGMGQELFLEAIDEYNQKNYILAAEHVASLLLEKKFFPEHLIAFYSQILNEIAKRSTSLNNDYTRFLIKYPYFFTPVNDDINLKVSPIFLNELFEINPKSPMLQYLN